MSDSRWRQDPEVFELIEHLNQPEKRGDWFSLSKEEIEVVLKEISRCRKDFVYAARNYFWITSKDHGDQLLTLNQSQELIYQKMLELKHKIGTSDKAVKLVIIKGRQLGCSTLIEALIAWRTIFFRNVNALIVSYDRGHTADAIFPIMTTIYDRLPWWLQPELAMRRIDEGLHFATKDQKMRSDNPGMNSRVYLKAANTTTSVGMGFRLNAVHVSEFAAFEEKTARTIIDEEMRHAIVDNSDSFAVLESTAKGANKYAHTLWKQCEELAEQADWYPLFLPAFFESKRQLPPPPKWNIARQEQMIRDQVVSQWLRCDNKICLGYHMRTVQMQDRSETKCPTCNVGMLHPYVLTDRQVYFMEYHRINSARDEEATRKLKQELCTTALEAFQVQGIQIFGPKAQDFAAKCILDPIAAGHFDLGGRFHGPNKNTDYGRMYHEKFNTWACFVEDCKIDHEYDDNPLLIWEWPIRGAEYTIGGDVAEGLGGKADYSVGVVNLNTPPGGADRQVATWRSNTVDPISFAYQLNWLGLMYNSALMAVECNKYDACLGALRFNLNYPNMYRWKHMDSVNINSNKLGWYTDMKSRPRLWQTFKLWLNQEMIYVRSKNCYNEMLNFVKDDEDSSYAGGDKKEHDDEVISIMISLFCSKEGMWNPILGMALPAQALTKENTAYTVRCLSCNQEWYENQIEDKALDPTTFGPDLNEQGLVVRSGGVCCSKCKSRRVEITRNQASMLAERPDGSVVREIGNQDWSPEDEWDKIGATVEYDLL